MFSTIYLQTTAHPWCDGHSISISACGVWGVGGKGRDSNLQEGVSYTYIFRLLYSRILSCVKKKKKKQFTSKVQKFSSPIIQQMHHWWCFINVVRIPPLSSLLSTIQHVREIIYIYICKNFIFVFKFYQKFVFHLYENFIFRSETIENFLLSFLKFY